MMTLTREKGNRMWGGGGASAAGGGGSDMSGFASQGWVDENYLSKSFFSTLFIIHATQTVTVTDNQGQPVGEPVVTEITLAPNQLPGTTSVTDEQGNTTTTAIAITSIEATTNFYSDGGVSALGQSSGGGGGGATALTDLVDVAISNPSNGQVLKYNSTTNKWENANESGGGISMSDVWTALAASTSEQINASHLSETLNGYATQQWVGQQGYITNSALSGYATQQWVGQQGYITNSALSGYATQQWVGQQGFLTSSDITNMVTGGSIFGNSFTGNPSIGTSSTHASLNYVSSIFMSGDIKMNNNKAIYIKDSGATDRSVLTLGSGNVLVLGYGTNAAGYATQLRGATIDYYTYNNNAELHVGQWTSDGQLYLKQGTQGLRIGDALLTWDSTNKVLNLTNTTTSQTASFAASGGVSALGLSSEGNGGRIQNLTVTGTLKLGDTIVANTSPSIVRQEKDSDCLSLLNAHTVSKDTKQKYYYNQYDNVGLLGTDYTYYTTTWWIDPDGCALFKRVYLSDNVYLFTDGSNIKVSIGSTFYTLTKS